MKVSIVGSGYVGLVSGACLAEKGHHVTCVDLHRDRVDRTNRGDTPIYEKGLSAILQSVVGRRLAASTHLHRAVPDSVPSILPAGTPLAAAPTDLRTSRAAATQVRAALPEKQRNTHI